MSKTEEYNSKPVPLNKRMGFSGPAWVWSGFGIAFICAVIGGIIQQGLGTVTAIWAIIIGNAILFGYSAIIGYASGEWGVNFPLTVRYVFGKKGAVIPILILSLLVTGWYAFQAWLTADIIKVAFGLEGKVLIGFIAVIAGVVFAAPVIFGIQQMVLVRKIAIPAMILFVLYYLITKVFPQGGELFASKGTGAISFWTGVGMAWATFVVSGTMTGDIVRYTDTGKQAVEVTAVAFIFSNTPMMIIGCLISAAINDASVVYFFDAKTMTVLVPLVVLAILSNWSTCDACLYNAAMGYSNALNINWKTAAIMGSIIGLIAAATGVIGNIVGWLILLGLLVPPIGGTIIADFFYIRGKNGFKYERSSDYNWAAIIAVIIGVIFGYYINQNYPNFIFGLPGIISSFIIYLLLATIAAKPLGAEIGNIRTGAESKSNR
jgi:cytosine permease